MRLVFLNPQGNFDADGSYLSSHPDFGGQLVYVRELALALGELGHQADIVTRRIEDPEWPEFATDTDAYPGHENVRILRIPCGPPGFLPKEELWPHLGEWASRIAELYEREGLPDLFTGHYADGGLCAALLEERTGVPFSFTAHSLGAWKLDGLLREGECELEELDERYAFGARLAAERAAISRAAEIVTSGETERCEQYDHPAYHDVIDIRDDSRFAVIPPGVNLSVFDRDRPGPREEEVKSEIRTAMERDISPERRNLPAVIDWSRLDPKKNHLGLVRAFARSPELHRRANLLIVTRGVPDPLRNASAAPPAERAVIEELARGIQDSGLGEAVSAFSLAGQDALAALYRWGAEGGSVFCLPAGYEPFGLSLVEAMASGLPVVATKNGGPREITAGGEIGLLADPHDPSDLAARLLDLIANPGLWREHAENGCRRAARRYSWQAAAESYAELAREASSRGLRTREPLPDFATGDFASGDVASGQLPRLKSWRPAPYAP